MSVKKNNSLEVIKTSSASEGIEKVEKLLKEVKAIEETKWKTNGQTEFGDLKTMTDIGNIVKAYSAIKAREDFYNAAQIEIAKKSGDEALAGTIPLFTINGSTTEDWLHDTILRLKIINQKFRMEKLQGMKKRYEDLMDKQDKLSLLQQEMEEL